MHIASHGEASPEGGDLSIIVLEDGPVRPVNIIGRTSTFGRDHLADTGRRQVKATSGVRIGGDLFDERIVRSRMLRHLGYGSVYGRDKRLPVPAYIFEALARLLIAAVSAYVLATLSWHVLEHPFLRMKRHFDYKASSIHKRPPAATVQRPREPAAYPVEEPPLPAGGRVK